MSSMNVTKFRVRPARSVRTDSRRASAPLAATEQRPSRRRRLRTRARRIGVSIVLFGVLVILGFSLAACEEISLEDNGANGGAAEDGQSSAQEAEGEAGAVVPQADLVSVPRTISLTSTAFTAGARIPSLYTAQGEDVSPPLQWSNVPREAESLVLIVEDIDAPSPQPWVHWLVYGIAPDVDEFPAGIARGKANVSDPFDLMQGRNSFSWNDIGWRGPAPPEGDGPHRYVFRIFALDADPALDAGLSRDELMRRIKEHIIGMGELVGTFSQPSQ